MAQAADGFIGMPGGEPLCSLHSCRRIVDVAGYMLQLGIGGTTLSCCRLWHAGGAVGGNHMAGMCVPRACAPQPVQVIQQPVVLMTLELLQISTVSSLRCCSCCAQQLGFHAKPVGLLNINGFYDKLIAFFKHCVEQVRC